MKRAVMTMGLAVLTAACSVFGGEAAEEVPFEVVREDGDFELRAYGPVVVARTRVDAGFEAATDPAFRRLFDYISGANEGSREVAMTAPVTREAAGTEIAMTAPVYREGAEADGWVMEFALPAEFTMATAPVPTDPEVELYEHPAKRMAVLGFSGRVDQADFAARSAELLDWVAAEGLSPAGPVRLAGYNPPWTIPAMRRNEVLVAVE